MCIIYTLYSTSVDPYPGKKANFFKYAKGLSSEVDESGSMGNKTPPMKIKYQLIIILGTASWNGYYYSGFITSIIPGSLVLLLQLRHSNSMLFY